MRIFLTAAMVDAEVLGHEAVSRAQLAPADAVHLHPTQVNQSVLHPTGRRLAGRPRRGADDPAEVVRLVQMGVNRFCTNDLVALLAVRDGPG